MPSPAAPLPWDLRTTSEAETVALGEQLASLLAPGDLVRLRGELGAGKTCLVRGLAQGLGADPTAVHSPSFSLVHLYRDAAGDPALYHVDLYRIEGTTDLREIGLEEVMGSDVPTAVEWAERLTEGRFAPRPGEIDLSIQILGPDERRIQIHRLT
jgi:tRNA threonylcarbamoyladenosine biosynthesis protein TsaE